MTEAEIKNIAESAADGALRKFLLMLGVDVSTGPATIELQKDFAHVRETRLTRGILRDKVLATITGSAVTFILGAIGYYVVHH